MAYYSIEFKAQLIKEYKKGENGYKLIAKKYNMTRDAIRGIIRSYLSKSSSGYNEMLKKKVSPFEETKKLIEDYILYQ